MSVKNLIEKMSIEIDAKNVFRKPILDYWNQNSTEPIDSLLSYGKGFCDGVNFVFETLVRPHIESVDKILHP
jgi:hypothetical protein